MTRDDLVAELLDERFGPFSELIRERARAVKRRRRPVLAVNPADAFMPPPQRVEIGPDVAALAQRGWSAEQIAALLRVDVARVRRLLGHRIPPGVGNPTMRGAA